MQNKAEYIESTYASFNQKLLNFIGRYVPRVEAEDILQDVFTQLFTGFEQIRSFEHLSSWLYKTSMNRVIDWKKKKKPELLNNKPITYSNEEELYLEDILPSLSDSPEDGLFKEAIWKQVEEALDQLPEEQREVFVLHEFEGRSFKEIEKITGDKINTLISRKRYVVVFLREKLNELYNQLKFK